VNKTEASGMWYGIARALNSLIASTERELKNFPAFQVEPRWFPFSVVRLEAERIWHLALKLEPQI
jgi:hypothetical protein